MPAEPRRGKKSPGTGAANSSEVSEAGAGKWSMVFRKSKKNPLISQANYRSKTALLFFIISDDFTVSIKVLKSW